MKKSTAHFLLVSFIGLMVLALSLGILLSVPRVLQAAQPTCTCMTATTPGWLWPTAGLAAAMIAWIAVVTVRTVWQTRRFVRLTLVGKRPFQEVIAPVGIDLIPNSSVVFCYGFFQPRIALGDRVVARLSGQELRAVVSHEASHALRRDPLRLLVVTSIGRFFGRWGEAAIIRPFTLQLEFDADQATEANHGRDVLAHAFVSLLSSGQSSQPTIAVPFLSVTESRILRLLGEGGRPSLRRPLLIAVLVASLGFFGGQAVRATSQPTNLRSQTMPLCQRQPLCTSPHSKTAQCLISGSVTWCLRMSSDELFTGIR